MTEQQLSPSYHTHESQRTPEEIQAYWTEERQAAAQPLPPPFPSSKARPADENHPIPASPTAEEPSTLYYKTTLVRKEALDQYPYQSIGKLFFTLDKKDQQASASVVDENGLITAAHCLYSYETKTWADSILFCPAYANGHENAKYGSWTGRDIAVPRGWMEGRDRDAHDVGFIKLHLGGLDRKPIGNIVSKLPLLVGMVPVLLKTVWFAVGYPRYPREDTNFDGKNMWQCEGDCRDIVEKEEGVISTVSKSGNFTQGSSGGPWLYTGNDKYEVNGVGSTIDSAYYGMDGSPYFGEWVMTAFLKYFKYKSQH